MSKSYKLPSFPDTEVYSFNLGTNFLTFGCLKNVNWKRNETFNFAIPVVLGVMNQFTLRIKSVFPADICLDIAFLQTYIAGYENKRGSGRLSELRNAVEEDVRQYFHDNPDASIQAAARY